MLRRKHYPPHVTANVVAKDNEWIIPQDGGRPFPGGNEVHDIGNGVVEAAEDEERYAENNRQHGLFLAVQPYCDVYDKTAAHCTEENVPGRLGQSAGNYFNGAFLSNSADRQNHEADKHAGNNIEQPDESKAADIIHDTGAACIERRAGKHYTYESECKDNRTGNASQHQKTKCAKADEKACEKRTSVFCHTKNHIG